MKKNIMLIMTIVFTLSFISTSFAVDTITTEKDFYKMKEKMKEKIEQDITNSILSPVKSHFIKQKKLNMIQPRGVDPDVDIVDSDTTFYNLDLIDYDTEESGAGAADAKASGSLYSKKLWLRADAPPLYTSAEAWGYLGKEFMYDGNSSKSVDIIFYGRYQGHLVNSFNPGVSGSTGKAKIKLSVEVWDAESDSRVARRTVLNESVSKFIEREDLASSFNETLQVNLKPGHVYKTILRATVEADGFITGTGISSFHKDYGSDYIMLKKVKVDF